MTQCTKQFDPLKKCQKRSGQKVDYLKIELHSPRLPIFAWERRKNEDPKFLGHHYPCGHYFEDHKDTDADLINVEEESEINIEQINDKLHNIENAFDFLRARINELKLLVNIDDIQNRTD